jgi:hypothetical protein
LITQGILEGVALPAHADLKARALELFDILSKGLLRAPLFEWWMQPRATSLAEGHLLCTESKVGVNLFSREEPTALLEKASRITARYTKQVRICMEAVSTTHG